MNDTISKHEAIEALCKVGCGSGYCGVSCDDVKAIEQLPSAQPKIIHCKDCKWKQGSECVRFADVRPFPNDFCSRAERRTDE